MAEISWIKLKTTMFDDEKIRLIQAVPEADAIVIVWIRLLVLAGKTNDDGLIYIQRNMPYTEEMLATLFGKNVNTIRLALNTLASFNMIDLADDGMIAISNWEKHQNIEGMELIRDQTAKRTRKYRERKKQLALESHGDATVTSRDATDIDIDKDIDKEIDIDKDIKSKELSSVADAPTTSPQSKPKNVKQVKHKHGEYENVLLTDKEFETLKAELGDDLNYWIEKVSGYMAGNGNKNHYKNFLAVIRNWSKNGKDKARQQYQYQNYRPSPKLPDWVDKDISETEMSADEKEKFEARISRLKERRND